MSSYYDDPDFADEYRRRDEEALDTAIREREVEDEAKNCRQCRDDPGSCPRHGVRLGDGCIGGHSPSLVSCELGAEWP